jgi:hypothetical protein
VIAPVEGVRTRPTWFEQEYEYEYEHEYEYD